MGRPRLAPHPPVPQLHLPSLSSFQPASHFQVSTRALRTDVVGCEMSLSSCLALCQLLPTTLRDSWPHPGGSC